MKINKSNALSLLASLALVSIFSACGNNPNTITSTSNNPGAGAIGAGVDQKSCQVGQVHSTEYGCLNRSGCGSTSTGFSTQANRCVTGTIVTEEMKFGRQSMTRHYGRLTVTNPTQMELMLQQAGLCNVNYGVAMSNTSSTRCATWIARGSFAVLKSYGGGLRDNINLTLGAGTQFPYDLVTILPGVYGSQVGLYNQSIYGNSNYLSFAQTARNFSFNNGNGMQIIGISPSNEPLNLMILVPNGNLAADHLEGQLVFQGVVVATLPLDRF